MRLLASCLLLVVPKPKSLKFLDYLLSDQLPSMPHPLHCVW